MSPDPMAPVYLEIGSKRVFAGAVEWPGWSRSGHDEEGALAGLVVYGPRYAAALDGSGVAFAAPEDGDAFEVVERLAGGSGTDFGVPSLAPAADRRGLGDSESDRQVAILQACWASFDRIAAAAVGKELARGPRGGGRELDGIVRHVLEAEQAYVVQLGGRYRPGADRDIAAVMAGTRAAALEALAGRLAGTISATGPRGGERWLPRYFVRRSAWHVLDHAWEIEDRAARV